MKFVILDLEWTSVYIKSQKKYVNEIIEFGAVKVNSRFKLLDTFSCLVSPQGKHKLTSFTKRLTGINDKQISAEGISLSDAVKAFAEFSEGCVIGTWSRSDLFTLHQNYKVFLKKDRIDFLTKYIDIQRYTQIKGGISPGKQLGLETAADLLNIRYDIENQHRALQDSILTMQVFERLYDSKEVPNHIYKANDDFYDRLYFKAFYLKTLDGIEPENLLFQCPDCSTTLKQITKFSKSKLTFLCRLKCPNCSNMYKGTLQVKKTYDDIVVKRKLTKI